MKSLFYQGGAAFMGVLTLLLLVLLVWNVYHLVVYSRKDRELTLLRKLKQGRSIGLFALVFGVLGQMLGLFQAFGVLREVSDISPSVIWGGVRVSMIATLYGIMIYLLALLIWFVATTIVERKSQK